jgi:hypothetical protein
VEKDHFLTLVRNFTSITAEEAGELTSLSEDFPYSQVVHNLAARAAKDNDLGSQEHLLHLSAIYTTDRTVLKSIMTALKSERKVYPAAVVEEAQPGVENKEAAEGHPLHVSVIKNDMALSDEALRHDLFEDIEKLKVSKHKFEVTAEAYDKALSKEGKKKPGKKSADEPADALIEEIKSTKKKVDPEGKQKEQIEIIENFIKTQPTIPKNKTNTVTDNSDLAEKSLLYGDNIVSETLVEILLKQGK